MYYTLKCDPKTTHDKYNCGEWDYLTYTYLYDHNATYDSTYKSANYFVVKRTSTPDLLPVTSSPTHTRYSEYLYNLNHSATQSFDSTLIGTGGDINSYPFNTDYKEALSYYLYSADELKNAGLDSGIYQVSGLI
jgi:hypothetical protein